MLFRTNDKAAQLDIWANIFMNYTSLQVRNGKEDIQYLGEMTEKYRNFKRLITVNDDIKNITVLSQIRKEFIKTTYASSNTDCVPLTIIGENIIESADVIYKNGFGDLYDDVIKIIRTTNDKNDLVSLNKNSNKYLRKTINY